MMLPKVDNSVPESSAGCVLVFGSAGAFLKIELRGYILSFLLIPNW
jgi:hypothetical protein